MPTERKMNQVEEIKDRLSRCSIAVSTNPTNLDSNNMNELRSKLRERDVEYRIVKNTLTYIAADEAEKPQLKKVVQGPTGLAFGYDDPRAVAQALEEFIRSTRSPLRIQGALLNQRAISPQEVSILAALPPKDEIMSRLLGQMQSPIARLVGQLQAPIAGLVTTLNGTIRGLGIVLQQRIQQLETETQE
jgi:large subunit ribosomal protein L10